MPITNQKWSFDIFTKYLHGTWSLLNILMIFGIKKKSIILTIAINIPVLLKTGFVVQGNMCLSKYWLVHMQNVNVVQNHFRKTRSIEYVHNAILCQHLAFKISNDTWSQRIHRSKSNKSMFLYTRLQKLIILHSFSVLNLLSFLYFSFYIKIYIMCVCVYSAVNRYIFFTN